MGAKGALLVLVSVAFAGCVVPAADDPAPASVEPPLALEGLSVPMRGCSQAGGHSTYDKDEFDSYGILPAPWVSADVAGDVGRPVMSSSDRPHMGGPIVGNYHVSVVCDSYEVNGEERQGLGFGFVTIRVEAPPFDAGPPADAHYLITMISFTDEDVAKTFQAAGVHATVANAVVVEPRGPVLHSLFDDPGHGVYESFIRYESAGKLPARLVRLWLLQGESEGHHAAASPDEGHASGPYRPVAIDMEDTEAEHLQSVAYGTFTHLDTADHAFFGGPLGPMPPGAVGQIPGLGYRAFDRTLHAGVQPDVILEEMYAHL